MDRLSMKGYQHKGLEYDKKILTNMLSLWSPYLKLEDIVFRKVMSNPSHEVLVTYDLEPLRNKFREETDNDGTSLRDLGVSMNQYTAYYPVMKNLNLFKEPNSARLFLTYGNVNEKIEFKEGHYYMGGSRPLVIYIDTIEEFGDGEKVYTMYVLNLWATHGGNPLLGSHDGFKGFCQPWFNIYKVPIRKLISDYKLDVTDWIDASAKISFMNWKGNPF